MINDYVEIKSGRIINLSFDIDVIVDKNYNKVDVIREVINTVIRYMDVNSHIMGEELYMGDLQKEISKVDGVINLISMSVINEFGDRYSLTTVSQETTEYDGQGADYKSVIDLEATDGVLYNEGDTMMEILYPEEDIRVRVKER